MTPPLGCIPTGAVARSSMRVPFLTAPRHRPLVTAIRGASLRSTGTAASSIASLSRVLMCSSRNFYDKIRERRDGSDYEGPEQMFQDFPKGPHRQRVPAELHRCSKDAVEGAERLNRIFGIALLLAFGGGIYALNPYRGDPYGRPDGYGMTEPKTGVRP
ncbi:hypothetical protein NXY56_000037 [Leishmania guyanensis]|uniref:Uncharacterized protein n=1 Tax=Leishmania guyanensis TaxID=5670 RepID=A0A1E1IN87_LEIGU|nr:hypothetical protein, conserved [Leishmania guyanensis]